MTTQHTPTPWVIQEFDSIIEIQQRGDDPPALAELPATKTGRANAELIVRAVNSHARLVAALEAAQDELSAIVDYRPDAVNNSTLDKISEALQLAKES